MTARKTSIARADLLLDMKAYAAERKARRAAIVALKKSRQIHVGPIATFSFECHATMLHQVQEMLYIEKGGEAQVAGELEAYNPLIPQGRELVATVMFEIEDPVARARELAKLGGIERRIALTFAGETVAGAPEEGDKTTEAGKTSAVHFMKFRFTPAQIAAFRGPGTRVVLGFSHPNYGHMAVLPEAMRAELAGDFVG